MKLCRCPICHSDLTLEALVEDDAGRELLKTITEMTAGCGRPAVAYLGLFKPQKSSLSNGRALRILQICWSFTLALISWQKRWLIRLSKYDVIVGRMANLSH